MTQQWNGPDPTQWSTPSTPRRAIEGHFPPPAPNQYPVRPAAGFGPPDFGGRRRRRNPLVTLLKVMLLLGLLGFLALVLAGWLFARVVQDSGVLELPQPSAKATTPEDPTATDAPTAAVPSAAYANDDYPVPAADAHPPELPEPQTVREATALLEANPLYFQTAARPVRCEMGTLDLQRASNRQLQAHLNQMMGCLMRVWGPPLAAAGYTPVRPTVTVYSGSVSTKCGRLGVMNASYCGADQQVYYADDLPELVPQDIRRSRFITESVVAHEFGHAVQARSGILVSDMVQEDQSTKAKKQEFSRRLEMQADCFAGQFLGSMKTSTRMTDAELANVQSLFGSIGDDSLTGRSGYLGTHGQSANRRAWVGKGLASGAIGTCNTFSAPSTSVR